MDVLNEIVKSLQTVATSNFFLQSMALVTIMAAMIGSIIYNGDLKKLSKVILSIMVYGGMIVLTNVARISASPHGLVRRTAMVDGQAFNGTTTVIYVTIFYIIGLFCGVLIHRRARK